MNKHTCFRINIDNGMKKEILHNGFTIIMLVTKAENMLGGLITVLISMYLIIFGVGTFFGLQLFRALTGDVRCINAFWKYSNKVLIEYNCSPSVLMAYAGTLLYALVAIIAIYTIAKLGHDLAALYR